MRLIWISNCNNYKIYKQNSDYILYHCGAIIETTPDSKRIKDLVNAAMNLKRKLNHEN